MISDTQAEANGRMMAAAPAMEKALRGLLKAVRTLTFDVKGQHGHMEAIEEAELALEFAADGHRSQRRPSA